MSKIKAWVSAARLRTLPLSISGIIVGTSLANLYGFNDPTVFILALITTISFQITSNFANDYGDGTKGTDAEDRIGPKRALQSGLLTSRELRNGIIFSIITCLILSITLIYCSFGLDNFLNPTIFLLLSLVSVWAAIRYTMGNSPYGYNGLGDLFVFLFFGLLAVLGTLFLYAKSITMIDFLPAISIGFLCVGVLNLNNLRDIESDKNHGKHTLVVKMGFLNGKKYHYTLLFLSFVSMAVFYFLSFNNYSRIFYLLAFIPVFVHLRKVYLTKIPIQLDTELKKLALSTFLLSLLFYIAVNYFS